MSKLIEYLKSSHEEKDDSPITISLGLDISLSLLNEIFNKIENYETENSFLSVSSILGTNDDPCSGLYISNQMNLKGVRMTRNGVAGCGRLYFGDLETIPYPERIPKESISPVDYEYEEISEIAEKIINYLLDK